MFSHLDQLYSFAQIPVQTPELGFDDLKLEPQCFHATLSHQQLTFQVFDHLGATLKLPAILHERHVAQTRLPMPRRRPD